MLLLIASVALMNAPKSLVPPVKPLPLSAVQITGGPFKHANEVCASYLLKVEPDRLLHSFRVHSGLEAKGKMYGGWENSGLAGHSLGHYLTACSQEYAATGDARFKAKVDYIVDELAACQKSRPDGCISAIPNGDKAFAEVKKGEIRSGGFDLNGMWSPWYTHHKVLAGLLDANSLAKNKKALAVASKFVDWMIDLTKDLTPEQWQKMLVCEYGGMNESLAELYSRTGDPRHLALSRKFYDQKVLDPLFKGVDELSGKHSNTQIPKLLGLARLFEVTGDRKDKDAAAFFWDRIVHHHTYVIGGNSNHEYLGPPDHLSDRLSSNTAETCNTYNMLKLTRKLFEWDPRPEYADFYERAHLNHILASQNPKDAMMTYFMPLGSGTHRGYSDEWDNWTCCHGSGMENHTKHADSVYFQSKGRLWVNLFMPTRVEHSGLVLEQKTNFPDSGRVVIEVVKGGPKNLELAIRHPWWAKGKVEFKVNGKEVLESSTPTTYAVIKRKWTPGDKLEFNLPMVIHTEATPDNPKKVALLYGPVVLAASLGSEESEAPRIPVLVTGNKPVPDWLEPAGHLRFRSKGIGRPNDLVFQPFYGIGTDRMAVYFDVFSQPEWEAAERDFRAEEARLKDFEARTVDFIRLGEMQPERDHDLKSERNDVREANGKGFRTAMAGGWFEFDMAVDSAASNELVVTYWGNERVKPDFKILVDGKVIATEDLAEKPSNRFYDVVYSIPADAVSGKAKVKVRFEPNQGKQGGSVSGVRVIRAKKG